MRDTGKDELVARFRAFADRCIEELQHEVIIDVRHLVLPGYGDRDWPGDGTSKGPRIFRRIDFLLGDEGEPRINEEVIANFRAVVDAAAEALKYENVIDSRFTMSRVALGDTPYRPESGISWRGRVAIRVTIENYLKVLKREDGEEWRAI